MTPHAPAGYACPLCRVADGAELDAVVHADDRLIAALSLHQKARNPGALLIFPRAHVENLYAAEAATVQAIFGLAQRLSVALKRALGAGGITLIQNNEPAGGQDVWHLHAHVVPRYEGDQFYVHTGRIMPMAERAELAARIREALQDRPKNQ